MDACRTEEAVMVQTRRTVVCVPHKMFEICGFQLEMNLFILSRRKSSETKPSHLQRELLSFHAGRTRLSSRTETIAAEQVVLS